MHSTTRIQTEKASGYLQQLCKHFAHKCEVSFDAARGVVTFPMARADLAAEGGALDISITADDAEGLDCGQTVICSHLQRFAFREDLPAPVWTRLA
ncbi:DUF2218 domain-containing protein [Roseibacterium beibuensis]|uniref:DUF2218 domain-containing protein n=1 Tax=[Roseibacterium] beibuensis TaxID=1193142 RepID=A0ABP9KSW9_9RHOB|nr:DUF2218 domain-containing protein [Roseibacterium beibuensis]MCS6622267.1 DUF2218 domain-containing protein [Roseibacterium beibuensis]